MDGQGNAAHPAIDAGPSILPAMALAQDNPYAGNARCSKLEGQLLGEYARMAGNLDKLNDIIARLAASSPELLDSIVPLERKLGLIFTLFKASVWATRMAEQEAEEAELYDA